MVVKRIQSQLRRLPAELSEAQRNRLLAALPPSLWGQWQLLLEHVEMPAGTVVHEAGETVHYVYFPLDCVVSMMLVLANGESAQVAVVGCEGLVGVPVFLGGGSSRTRAVVQSAGTAVRLPAEVVSDEFDRGGELVHLLLRFTQALIAQMSQTAVCNRHHTPEQQFCRWLLLSLDRASGPEIEVTQELVASMLGVRRETVTEAARRLQSRGVIRSRRGHIRVLDGAALERSACECYGVVKQEYARLLPRVSLPRG
jgi:CRP-like cAMP-binding protein